MVTAQAMTGRSRARLSVRVHGTVQGVGFRPYVYGLGRDLGLGGFVGNDAQGVFIEAEGDPTDLAAFVERLPLEAPPLAVVEQVSVSPIPAVGERSFLIVASTAVGARDVAVSPDVATCAECLREVFDPRDRRHGYPFTNCTHCGPRFTIIRDVPYDRAATTMAGFAMCADCEREYHDPADRRFHAQPVCCPACGPRLRLMGRDGRALAGDPIHATAGLLRDGRVVAVKGLGGYHLAVDAANEAAAESLRARKHREDKPFALMVPDAAAARQLCDVSTEEESLLASPARPVVLLRRRPDARVAPSVAPGNRSLGTMLPYTPLHHLLAAAHGAPFVLTSGNLADEPIAYDDRDAFARLGGVADAFLTHDRPIHMRVDDSVVRIIGGSPTPLRRSRGYAPQPLGLPWSFPRPVLACGAELKNTVCLGKGKRAYVSHHIGDLENYETFRSFTQALEHLCRLFDVAPEVVAHDLHPEYLSTKHATELDGLTLSGVQHHHAHVASCLADNGVAGPAIGVAFDGLGLGTDGTLWGGEILVADLCGFERVGHLDTVPMPGAAAAIREPWRMAAAHLQQAFPDDVHEGLSVARRNSERWPAVLAVAGAGVNSPMTSSVGRLFDAVAAILGVRDTVNYEGQAAVELEQWADPQETDTYPTAVVGGGEDTALRIRGADLVRAVVADLEAGVGVSVIAARFHNSLAQAVVGACRSVREDSGLSTVALSGGVFQNVLLVRRALAALEAAGFRALCHSRVPPNDGGISLGQAAVAGARDRADGR